MRVELLKVILRQLVQFYMTELRFDVPLDVSAVANFGCFTNMWESVGLKPEVHPFSKGDFRVDVTNRDLAILCLGFFQFLLHSALVFAKTLLVMA